MWWLTHHRERAMWWYNRAFMRSGCGSRRRCASARGCCPPQASTRSSWCVAARTGPPRAERSRRASGGARIPVGMLGAVLAEELSLVHDAAACCSRHRRCPRAQPGKVWQPILAVTAQPAAAEPRAMLLHSSRSIAAQSPPASGIRMPNSSPPMRPSVSLARVRVRRISATSFSASSPTRCPCESLSALKPSRSSTASENTPPPRRWRRICASSRAKKVRRLPRLVSGWSGAWRAAAR